MNPPCVGSGWRVINVAVTSPDSGNASSPSNTLPSSVVNSTFSRRAGRTVEARISDGASCGVNTNEAGSKVMQPSLRESAVAVRPARPAVGVPVPAFGQPCGLSKQVTVGPHHQMRDAGDDGGGATRADVLLFRLLGRHGPHHPVPSGALSRRAMPPRARSRSSSGVGSVHLLPPALPERVLDALRRGRLERGMLPFCLSHPVVDGETVMWGGCDSS